MTMSSTRPGLVTYGKNSRNVKKKTRIPPSVSLPLDPPDARAYLKVEPKNLEDSAGSVLKTLTNAASIMTVHSELSRDASRLTLQTPFPTEGNDTEVYKLCTTKPLPDSPGHRFSPVPLGDTNAQTARYVGKKVIKKKSRTTSRSLKENMKSKLSENTHISGSRSINRRPLSLASPFTSRPSSPPTTAASLVLVNGDYADTEKSAHQVLRSRHRASLSDTLVSQQTSRKHTGPEVGVITQSTTSRSPGRSLTRGRSGDTSGISHISHQRMLSAPVTRPPASRGFTSPTFSADNTKDERGYDSSDLNLELSVHSPMAYLSGYDFLCDSDTYFQSSLEGAVDFNRPPSQMSLRVTDDDDIFTTDLFLQLQGRSTPNRAHAFPFPSSSLDLGEFVPRNGSTNNWQGRAGVQEKTERLYSSWITDSIISPPSYHNRQKDKALPGSSVTEQVLEDTELSNVVSPTSCIAPDGSPQGDAEENGRADASRFGGGKQTRSLSTNAQLSKVVPPTRIALPLGTREAGDSSCEGDQDRCTASTASPENHWLSGYGRTRSGTIVQNASCVSWTSGRRNRSGTIVQGGGGARRTRSGTVVQKRNVNAKPNPSGAKGNGSGENEAQQENSCSCCSSDDELMLRSHSHHDVGAEDLAWTVADPPSPVIKRLRRAKRQNALRRRNRGRNNKGASKLFASVAEDEDAEDGIEGDIDDDELDLLGTIVPEDW